MDRGFREAPGNWELSQHLPAWLLPESVCLAEVSLGDRQSVIFLGLTFLLGEMGKDVSSSQEDPGHRTTRGGTRVASLPLPTTCYLHTRTYCPGHWG